MSCLAPGKVLLKATDRVLAIVRPEAVEELDRPGQVLIVVAVVAQEGNLLVEAVEEAVMTGVSYSRNSQIFASALPSKLIRFRNSHLRWEGNVEKG
ncbi:hypothetical protein EK904_011814 [Melospiza melodia maxima]|nr:hypothetical protein EK904_011814 [Melospiza melodia maxima]